MADLSEPHGDRQQRSRLGLALLLALVPTLVIFGAGLGLDREFAFRDVAHYYSPYWQYTQQQWSSGELPLWNPLEENGRPLAADPTAGVFYPGKLPFFLPFSFSTALKLFLVLHLGLAVICMYAAARSFGRSPLASVFASLTYAFGGSIVFQYCNPIYLVGAAWLPWGVAAVLKLMRYARLRDAIQLGIVMAMCVLGGNPQSAYLLGLVALIRFCLRDDAEFQGQHESPSGMPGRLKVMLQLGCACLLAAGLSAMQLLPALEWTQVSERKQVEVPQSIYGLAWSSEDRVADWQAMLKAPETGSHRASQYNFSIGPWRWPELLWPNFSGRAFPVNTRWSKLIPAEGRFWSPTLYMGILPFLFGLFAFRLRKASSEQRWLSWCVLIFAGASLGEYGLGWLRNEISIWLGQTPTQVWGPLGGGYWLMNLLLPGFALFRYPAKLWTLVAIGLSLLAAKSFDNVGDSRRPMQKTLAVYVGGSLVMLLVSMIYRPPENAEWLAEATDSVFGPLDLRNALWGLRWTFISSLVVGAIAWLILRGTEGRAWMRFAIVVLTVVDISIANRWLAPAVVVPEESRFVSMLQSENAVTYRWQVGGWYPERWSHESNPSRLQQVVAWDVHTLRPKCNLRDEVGALNSSTSFSTASHRDLLELLRDTSMSGANDDFVRLIKLMGVDYVVAPATVELEHVLEPVSLEQDSNRMEARLWKTPNPFSRGWIVHQWMPQTPSKNGRHGKSALKDLLLNHDLSQMVFLAPDARPLNHGGGERKRDMESEWCQVIEESPGRLRIEAELETDGFVVLRDSYAPGWRCTQLDTGESMPVLQANELMRAVALPAGRHSLSMEYRPMSVSVGITVSAFCWLALLVILCRQVRSERQTDRLAKATHE